MKSGNDDSDSIADDNKVDEDNIFSPAPAESQDARTSKPYKKVKVYDGDHGGSSLQDLTDKEYTLMLNAGHLDIPPPWLQQISQRIGASGN